MKMVMAGQFVTRLDDPPNQRGIAFGDPTQGEESAGGPRLGEHRQHRVAITLDPAFERRPVGTVDRALKSADLKPVLDIDRQAVLHRPSPHTPSIAETAPAAKIGNASCRERVVQYGSIQGGAEP